MIEPPVFLNPLELGFALLKSFVPAGAMYGVAEPDVSIKRRGRLIEIHAGVRLPVDLKIAWGVLTDYDHLADFVPDLASSRVIDTQGRFIIVKQDGEARFGISALPVEAVLRIEEFPCSAVRFQSIAGNIGNMEGEWRLAPEKGSVDIRYRTHLEPALSISPFIEDTVLRHGVQGRLQGVAREMARRKAAASPLLPAHCEP